VSSRLGYGSIFHLYFPVAPSELLPLPTALKPITRGTGQRVLFVDDERILCNVARRLLHDLGYVPTICADPAEALDEVRRDPGQFDAVITDLSMPGMTGLELTEALLQLRPDLPVILATGFAGDITPESARAAGLRDLIAKPTSTRAIADVLQRAFAPST